MASEMKRSVFYTRHEASPDDVANLVLACNSECHDGEELARQVIEFLFGTKLSQEQQDIIVGTSDGSFTVEPNDLGGATVVFEEEWPDTYRCRQCGSEDVAALAWVSLNERDYIGDWLNEDFEYPKSESVQCNNCGHLGGAYAHGEGPDDGKYPEADDE